MSGKPKAPERRHLQKRICDFCRRRHLRCDGKEPSCLNCENRRAPCVYTTDKAEEITSNTVSRGENEQSNLPIERPAKKRKISDSASGSTADPAQSVSLPKNRNQSSSINHRDWSAAMTTQQQPQQQLAPNGYFIPTSASTPQFFYAPFLTTPPPPGASPQPFLYQPHLQQSFPPTPPLGTPTLPVPIPGMPYLTGAQYNAAVINSIVLPIASPRPPAQPETSSLKRYLETEKHRIHLVPTSTLVKAFGESVIFAYGNRYSGNQPLSKKYADKAFQIMLLIIATRSNNAEEFAAEAQAMAASMEILSFYMVGSLELVKNRYIIDEAKRLWDMYPSSVKIPTLYRILTMHVGSQIRDADTLPLLKMIDDLNLPMDESGVSGYVALIVLITGRYCVREHLSMLTVNPDVTDEQRSFWTMVSEMADKASKCVDVMESNVGPDKPLVRIYRGMILGARGIISWRLGDKMSAFAHAKTFLDMGFPPPGPKLAYLLGFGYALQIFRMLGYTDLLKQGLAILDTGAPMFPMLHNMAVELRRPYRPEDYMTNDKVTLPPAPSVRPHPYEQLIAPTPPPISAIQPTISNLTAGDAPERGPDDPPPIPTPPLQEEEEVTTIVGPSWTAPPPPPLSPSCDAVLEAVNEYFGSYLSNTNKPSFEHPVNPLEMWNSSLSY